MNNYITKITAEECDRYSQFKEVTGLYNDRDIATFLDTFQASGIDAINIIKVLEKDGKYIFVYSKNSKNYDFFEEIGKLNKTPVNVNALNAKFLFSKNKSRGYYSNDNTQESTGDIGVVSDESATGFLEDNQYLEDLRVLIHNRTNTRLPIDERGIIIGRSSVQSDYVVDNRMVSRKHARIYKVGSKCMVTDLDSANGTFIDGLRVSGGMSREILPGSKVLLANEEFILQ